MTKLIKQNIQWIYSQDTQSFYEVQHFRLENTSNEYGSHISTRRKVVYQFIRYSFFIYKPFFPSDVFFFGSWDQYFPHIIIIIMRKIYANYILFTPSDLLLVIRMMTFSLHLFYAFIESKVPKRQSQPNSQQKKYYENLANIEYEIYLRRRTKMSSTSL